MGEHWDRGDICHACSTNQILTKHVHGCPGELALMVAIGRWEQRPLFVGENGPIAGAKRDAVLSMMARDVADVFGVPALKSAIERVLQTKEAMRQSTHDQVAKAHERVAILQTKVDEYEERFRGWPALEDVDDCIRGCVVKIEELYRGRLGVRDGETEPHSG